MPTAEGETAGAAPAPTQPRMRWWGWGVEGHDRPVPPAAEAMLRETIGLGSQRTPPVDLEQVRLPRPDLRDDVRRRLEDLVGEAYLRDDRLARVTHAAGKSYPDLVRIRSGDASGAPDAVAFPGTAKEVSRLVELCSEQGVAVVPFGGGTSVVGGVEALRGPHAAAVSIDLARLDRLHTADGASLTATVEAGMTGPALELALGARGLTLGHFPQSYEFSTLGGWVAARSAGQASTGYGRIDELVLGLRCATPAGELVVPPVPATAAGPDPRQLILGSEGALGVITEVTLQVRPAPAARAFEGWAVPSFQAGVELLRRLEQSQAAPDVARLSDEDETAFGIATIGDRAQRAVASAYLRARRLRRPCLVVFGFEGSERSVRARRLRARRLLRGSGAVSLGRGAGRSWERSRFHTPYLRDELLSRGALVDTLETATTWNRLSALHARVGEALRESLASRGTPAYVMCHVSHLYPSGASLYFTFFARREHGAELDQWRAAKAAASEAIRAGGGTITHHHGVGTDHAPWLAGEAGEVWVDALRALKGRLDPDAVMNPGKLLEPDPVEHS